MFEQSLESKKKNHPTKTGTRAKQTQEQKKLCDYLLHVHQKFTLLYVHRSGEYLFLSSWLVLLAALSVADANIAGEFVAHENFTMKFHFDRNVKCIWVMWQNWFALFYLSFCLFLNNIFFYNGHSV